MADQEGSTIYDDTMELIPLVGNLTEQLEIGMNILKNIIKTVFEINEYLKNTISKKDKELKNRICENDNDKKTILKRNEEISQLNKLYKKLSQENQIYAVKQAPINRSNTSDIEEAISKKNLPAVKYYYNTNPALINLKMSNKLYPLLFACQNRCPDIVRYLLLSGAIVKPENQTVHPLIEASRAGHLSVVEALIDLQLNINDQDSSMSSALHAAIEGDRLSVVKYLIEMKADTTIKNSQGKTPLEWAQEKNKTAIVNYLSSRK